MDERDLKELKRQSAEHRRQARQLMADSHERVRRHEEMNDFYQQAQLRREMRLSRAGLAALAAEHARRAEEEVRYEREVMDHVRDEVLAMIADGWTAAELADVGIGPALLAQLGITLPLGEPRIAPPPPP